MNIIRKMSLIVVTMLTILPATVFADDMQDAFLADMAEGLQARWAYDTDESTMTNSEFIESRRTLVNEEYERLKEYTDVDFESEKFDLLAHAYIRALETQLDALQYYTEMQSIFDIEWSDGYNVRAIVIPYMADHFGLAIEEEKVDEFRQAAEALYVYETVDSVIPEEEETTAEDSFEDIELYNDNGIIVSLTKVDADLDISRLFLTVENSTDRDVIVHTDNYQMYINKTNWASPINITVKAGKTVNSIAQFANMELRSAGIEKIDDIAMTIVVSDAETYRDIYKSDEIELVLDDNNMASIAGEGAGESNAEKAAADEEFLVFDNEGIKVYLVGMDKPDLFSTKINFRIENLNHHDITVLFDDYSAIINGTTVQSTLYSTVKSGKSANAVWKLYQGDLEKAGIDKIQELSFAIKIMNGNTGYDLYSGEQTFFSVDDNGHISGRAVYTDQETVRQLQELLNANGYECGAADGIPGKKTNTAILNFERDHGLPESTDITPELLETLQSAIG